MTATHRSANLHPKCARHPAATAGWVCSGCGARLCPDCAATKAAGPTSSYVVCASCGDAATRLVAPRSTLRPFVDRLLEAPGFVLSGAAVVAMVALAAFRTLLSYRGFAPMQAQAVVAGASVGAFWAYVFYIVRHTATGRPGLGVPDFRDVKEDLFAPAAKGAAATALVWAPALLYLLVANDWDFSALSSAEALNDPLIWLLLLVGVLYCPMALVAAATDIELLGILNPLQIVRYIVKAGRDYALTVGALVLVALPGALIDGLLVPALRGLPIPFISRWLAETASLVVPFLMARILGTLLHVHGDALDWGSTSDYEEPILRDARPRGTVPPPRRSATPARPPVEATPEVVAVAVADPIEILDLDLPPPAPPAAPPQAPAPAPPAASIDVPAAVQIARALAAEDLAQAVALYGAAPRLPAHELAADQHFLVGRAAANARQYPLAVRALKVAAFSPHEIAPRALVTLARVYGEGMQDLDSAERLFHEAVKRYPDTPAAAFARERLAGS